MLHQLCSNQEAGRYQGFYRSSLHEVVLPVRIALLVARGRHIVVREELVVSVVLLVLLLLPFLRLFKLFFLLRLRISQRVSGE